MSERITVTTYTNKKGNERASALFTKDLARRIAVNDPEAVQTLVDAITAKIEREERSLGDA